jgi:hypothetical protein
MAKKDDKATKAKKGKATAATVSQQKGGEPPVIALADHPRAAPAIRRAKAVGGLGGFAIAVLAGVSNGSAFSDMALRGVEFGLVGYLVAWGSAVAVWRRVLTAQATSAVRQANERRRVAQAELAELAESAR